MQGDGIFPVVALCMSVQQVWFRASCCLRVSLLAKGALLHYLMMFDRSTSVSRTEVLCWLFYHLNNLLLKMWKYLKVKPIITPNNTKINFISPYYCEHDNCWPKKQRFPLTICRQIISVEQIKLGRMGQMADWIVFEWIMV